MNPAKVRLLSQQLCAPQMRTPAELVSYMGAMQAQEYRQIRWGVAMRTKSPSLKAFKKAFDAGEIVRIHLMRGTWQLISREDYHWMLELLAPGGVRVTRGWMHSNGIDIPGEELTLVQGIFRDCLAGRHDATKDDIVRALAEHGIEMDDHRLSYHIRMGEYSGLLCSGDLLPNKITYCLTSEKLPSCTEIVSRDEALTRLTRKYFQSHQPATLEDFVWWSGLGVSDCRKGISLLGEEIHIEKWKGYEFYLLDSHRTRGTRKGCCHLIPAYDEFLIGYKSREISLCPHHSHFAHNNSGIFNPVVAHEGHICAGWKPLSKDGGYTFFDTCPSPADISDAWASYKRFINR